MDWQPIESAPRNGDVVLAWWGEVPVFIAWCDEGDVWRVVTFSVRHGYYLVAGNFAPFKPTHWMPLPDPPA